MQVANSIFVELRFWLLIAFSFALPGAIYAAMMRRQRFTPLLVLSMGSCLVIVAAFDVYLLQWLQAMVRKTPSLVDDSFFASEVSLALYVIPLAFGGIGVNVVSHVLIEHLLPLERSAQKASAEAQASSSRDRLNARRERAASS